jgi:hypothetical protein
MVLQGKKVRRGVLVAGLLALGALGAESGGWATAAAPSTASVVVPLEPARILDTRFGTGAPAGKVAPDQTISLQVTGVGGVPAGATGVVLNLTVTEAGGAGYVTAFPGGGARPNASVLNYSAGEDIANMVTATLSAAGTLDLYNAQSSVHLIADVAGYLTPDAGGGGTPGPQGPIGPIGPVGPAGPAATVLVNQPVAGAQAIGTYAGFALSANCAAGNISLTFNAVADGQIRITGGNDVFTAAAATEQIFIASAGGTQTVSSTSGAMLFSGVIDAAGALSSVELGIRFGSPCFVWGTIIPAS